MRLVHLVPVRATDRTRLGNAANDAPRLALLDAVAARLARELAVSCHVRGEPIDASPAFDAARRQFYATQILHQIDEASHAFTRPHDAVLGITDVDLFVPVLTFVFGEAQVAGRCALISSHRLHEAFYGLPDDPTILEERIVNEALHELGHVVGLSHCDDWQCVMSSAHAVERIDVRGGTFCDACRESVRFALSDASRSTRAS